MPRHFRPANPTTHCCCFALGVVLLAVGALRFNHVAFDLFDEAEVAGYEAILVDCSTSGVTDNEEENCVPFLRLSWETVSMVLSLIFNKSCYHEAC